MMKKITKVLAVGGIVTAGIAAAVKAAKTVKTENAKKEDATDSIIIFGPVKDTHCHRCTCHGVPVDKVVVGTPATGQSSDIGETIRKKKIIEANTTAMDSLDQDDRAFMESLIDFLRETELVDELDKSVTTASLIGYMKENGIFDEIHHICKKKNLACNDIEDIIHAVFKAGKFGKHMDAEQKLSIILDDISEDYFDSDLDEFDESDYE